MNTFVVDISNWQGNVDMTPWKAAGIQGCIAKALEGMTGVDAKWYQNKAKMLAWGGVPGAYHYINNIHTGTEQCNAFMNLVPGNFIHALDVEGPNIPLAIVDAWFAAYRKRYPNKTVWLYTNKGMWTQVCGLPLVDADRRWGPLAAWVAGSAPGAYQPGTDDFRKIWARVPAGSDGGLPFLGFDDYAAMQYTGSADVPGVPTPCDMSIFGGTAAELRAYTSTGAVDDMSQADVDAINAHLDAALGSLPVQVARAIHSQQLFAARKPDGSPLTIGDVLYGEFQEHALTGPQLEAAVDAALDSRADAIADAVVSKLGGSSDAAATKAAVLEALREGMPTFDIVAQVPAPATPTT